MKREKRKKDYNKYVLWNQNYISICLSIGVDLFLHQIQGKPVSHNKKLPSASPWNLQFSDRAVQVPL